jgi:hypothetical protein
MDPALGAAARALSAFDPLAALKRVALRDDAEALALRGVAMAQLGDYGAARKLLGRAARAFGRSDARARARCLAAQGDVALACRDVTEAGRALDAALIELDAQGDRLNALFVRLQRVRRLVLVGAVGEAAAMHGSLDLEGAPPRLRALADLVGADIAVRSLDPRGARAALARARRAARAARISSLSDEVERAARELDAPVARVVQAGAERLVGLDEVEGILRSRDLVVDACRRTMRAGGATVSLVTRPVLVALAVTLASALPGDATREALARAAFGSRRVTDSTRARLRVEIGRLRRTIAGLASVEASGQGYALRPRRRARVVVLLPPAPGEASALLALLRGGESWSTSALATALATSQRTVQRALTALRDEGRVEGIGRGRAQRWVARPPEGFATTLLLVVRGSSG